MKRIVSLFLVVAVLAMALPALAQEESKEIPKQKMKMFHVVMAKKGPNWKSQSSEDGMDIRMRLIENIRKAAAEGLVVSAGLVNDETDVEFIFIFDIETKTEVYNLMQKAELVKAGYYSVDAYSWFAPEGLTFQR
jgi:hypothetical protein